MEAAHKWTVRVLFAGFVIFLISAFPVADSLADAFARITWKRPDGPPSITVCLSENFLTKRIQPLTNPIHWMSRPCCYRD